MNQIELVLVGDMIAITLRSADKSRTRTRHVSLEGAHELSLLLDGGALDVAMNFEVDPGVTLQIENLPYERAWLGMSGAYEKEGSDLVACIEGESVAELGCLLADLVLAGDGTVRRKGVTSSYVCPVAYCYLDDEV